MEGERRVLAEQVRALLAPHRSVAKRRPSDLTERELEVLRLMAMGRSTPDIGAALFMSPKTASVHVSHILAKPGAASRGEAVAAALRQGILSTDDLSDPITTGTNGGVPAATSARTRR